MLRQMVWSNKIHPITRSEILKNASESDFWFIHLTLLFPTGSNQVRWCLEDIEPIDIHHIRIRNTIWQTQLETIRWRQLTGSWPDPLFWKTTAWEAEKLIFWILHFWRWRSGRVGSRVTRKIIHYFYWNRTYHVGDKRKIAAKRQFRFAPWHPRSVSLHLYLSTSRFINLILSWHLATRKMIEINREREL